MILDANDLPDGHPLKADLCIVGAGAAGISMAIELAASGLDVVVLEAGGESPRAEDQAMYEGTVADPRLHSPPDRYRQRRFGGTTTIWGGRCMPFDAIDFEARPQVPFSGWPIGLDALSPYYPRANELCEAGAFAYTSDAAFERPLRPMIDGFVSTHFTTDTLERFSCPTDFAARYGHKLHAATGVRVVLNAIVTELHTTASGRTVAALTVRTLAGKAFRVHADRVVLASGGLEVARLLLASRDRSPAGIGNEHDVVGRYYMCHIAGTIGTLVFDGPLDRIHHGYDIADDGVYCRRRIALAADTQRNLGLPNFVARLHHPRITDPAHRNGLLSLLNLSRLFIPYEYGKRLHGDEKTGARTWLLHVRNVVLDPFATIAFLWNWLRKRTLADRKFPSVIVHPKVSRYSLDFHAEQLPDPASRVTLGTERDAFGMPLLHVDWRYQQTDVDGVRRTLALLQESLRQSGAGRFDYDPAAVEFEMIRYGAYGGHHIGTARMGDDPRTSVVDANCKVHAMDNLFIAGSAVFPTSSQANPTLTIVAMGLRLADHLKRPAMAVASASPASPAATAPALRDREHGGTAKRLRIAVLGGDGFVGSAMVRALSASGWAEPVVIGRRSGASKIAGIERIRADAGDADALEPVLADVDGVINCVLGKGDTIARNASAVSAIASTRPDLRIVHVSSMAVYGPAVGDIAEDAPLVANDPYSSAKIEAEHVLARHRNVAILRPGIVYGPGGPQWSTRIAEWLVSHRIGDLGAAGDGYCNLIHVDDVAAAALLALREPEAGGQAYNLSMSDPPTWNAYFQQFAKRLGAVPVTRITKRRLEIEAKLVAIPLKVLELVGRRLKLSTSRLPQPIPPSLLVLWRHEIRLSMRKAIDELGLRPRPLDEGLRETAAAFLADRKRRK